MIHGKIEDQFSNLNRIKQPATIKKLLLEHSRIIAISETTKKDIIEIFT
jgi:hypothetical protein